MHERELHLSDITTFGRKSPSTVLQRIWIVSRDVFEILSIPSLNIPIAENGSDYLVLWPSWSGKSIFLKTVFTLLQWKKTFAVPDNTPCSVKGEAKKLGEFRVTFWDESGSQIRVNQFETSIWNAGPIVNFRISHNPVDIRIHQARRMPIIFISQGKVLFSWLLDDFYENKHDDIQAYVRFLKENINK